MKHTVQARVLGIVAKHINAMYRELENKEGVIHLTQVEHKSYKSGIDKICKSLFKAVARTYYDFGGR